MEIIQRIMTRNRCYTNPVKSEKKAAMLHSTGTPGATAANIIAAWDKPEADVAVEFVIDPTGIYQTLPLGLRSWHSGSTANRTHVACEICEPFATRVLPANWRPLSRGGAENTAYAVKLLQRELEVLGYDPRGIDGSFGPGCETALTAFQKDQGLKADGICGSATLAALQRREESYLRYPAEEAQAFFDSVYAKAVELFAWLMTEVGGRPEEILCHSEGFQKGIASNHADVMHWFPSHGKTMDDFRADVKATLSQDLELSGAVDKLTKAGIINSPEYWMAGNYSAENVRTLLIKFAGRL